MTTLPVVHTDEREKEKKHPYPTVCYSAYIVCLNRHPDTHQKTQQALNYMKF